MNSAKMEGRIMPRATRRMVQQYLHIFEHDERYFEADRAITNLIEVFPKNDELSSVLLKVVTINQLYSTKILATFAVAKHILGCAVDGELNNGELSAIEHIRFVTIGDRQRDFYVFATKYCSWHNLKRYPIYDSFVEKSLRHFGVANGSLRQYQNLKNSIDALIQRDGLNTFGYKQIDKFLWLYGKDI